MSVALSFFEAQAVLNDKVTAITDAICSDAPARERRDTSLIWWQRGPAMTLARKVDVLILTSRPSLSRSSSSRWMSFSMLTPP